MPKGIHYHHKNKDGKIFTPTQKQLNSFVDKSTYILSTLGVSIFIPQLIVVWTQKDIRGVSFMSWAGLCTASLLWFIYGAVHKEKPIMFANAIALVIQLLVIIGMLVHH